MLLPDPLEAPDRLDPASCTLVHVDAATERLIVERPSIALAFGAVAGEFVFVLVIQPRDAYYARAFRVENVQRPNSDAALPRVWLVLRPSGTWQRVERRRAQRIVVPSQFVEGRRYPNTGGLLRFDGWVRDISEGGVLLVTDQRLQLYDLLEFEVRLDRALKARARVLRVQSAPPPEQQKWLAGCKFEGLALDDSTGISEYVARQAASEPSSS